MPPARRRPPVGAARPPAGSIRRPKVAGRAASAPGVENDAVADDATSTTPTTGSVDLEKSPTAATTEPGTDTADTVESSEATDAAEPTTGRDTAWWTPKTMVLAALAVVFAVVALLGIIRPGTSEVSNQAWVDTAATQEVTSAGRDALQTVFSYKFDTIDQDQAAARAVLNDERRGEYDSTAEQTKQGVIQTQTTTNAVVTDIGVTLLDGDRAELLASMDIAATQDTVDQGTVQTPVSLTMERVDGKWLLATIDNR